MARAADPNTPLRAPETEADRERRRKHAKKKRDENRRRGRCLNETKHKKHAKPRPGRSKCDACLEAHRKSH